MSWQLKFIYFKNQISRLTKIDRQHCSSSFYPLKDVIITRGATTKCESVHIWICTQINKILKTTKLQGNAHTQIIHTEYDIQRNWRLHPSPRVWISIIAQAVSHQFHVKEHRFVLTSPSSCPSSLIFVIDIVWIRSTVHKTRYLCKTQKCLIALRLNRRLTVLILVSSEIVPVNKLFRTASIRAGIAEFFVLSLIFVIDIVWIRSTVH